MRLLLPLLMRGLDAAQSGNLVGAARDEGEECVELGFELLVGFVEGLQEGRIFGEEVAAQAGLLVHHELDEVVGMADDEVGVVYRQCTALDVLQAEAKDQSKDGERCNGQNEKAGQESVVLPRIHRNFPLFERRWLIFGVCKPDEGLDSTLSFFDANSA